MGVNAITRTAAIANETKGYPEFLNGMKTMPKNISVSTEAVLGDEWTKLDRSDKIKLGKAIMSNIKNGNLIGIVADKTIAGKAQTYKRIGEVDMRTIFSAPLWAIVDSMSKVFEMNSNLGTNWVYMKCFWEDGETFVCKILDTKGAEICEHFERKVSKAFFEKNEHSGTNEEFKAIISLWYGLDRAFENSKMLKEKGIDSICFLAPNAQMMTRIAAEKFDTSANSYDYTDFIQKQFADFKEAGIRELPFKYGIYALHNTELKK